MYPGWASGMNANHFRPHGIDHRAVQDRADRPTPADLDRTGRGRNRDRRLVHWFHTERLHSSINYLPPITYQQQYRQTSSQTGEAA